MATGTRVMSSVPSADAHALPARLAETDEAFTVAGAQPVWSSVAGSVAVVVAGR
ncbi:hypothetical protein [Curtobacterium sp. 24E2]|nr:hypothetical protein JN350_05560 [Curtobacterium sp. 24E2]